MHSVYYNIYINGRPPWSIRSINGYPSFFGHKRHCSNNEGGMTKRRERTGKEKERTTFFMRSLVISPVLFVWILGQGQIFLVKAINYTGQFIFKVGNFSRWDSKSIRKICYFDWIIAIVGYFHSINFDTVHSSTNKVSYNEISIKWSKYWIFCLIIVILNLF